MARLMSVSLTEPAVVDRTKTVTRRLGWRMLRVGDRLTLCRKVMGRRPGEPLIRIAEVEVTAVSREPLDAITPDEVAAEGFPHWTPGEFVAFFCDTHRRCTPATEVTRIQWRYLDSPPVAAGQLALAVNDRAARISSCGTYCDSLGRRWAPGPCLRWVMLGTTTSGQPRHPLYVPAAQPLEPWGRS